MDITKIKALTASQAQTIYGRFLTTKTQRDRLWLMLGRVVEELERRDPENKQAEKARQLMGRKGQWKW
jgi:hypothetical protein